MNKIYFYMGHTKYVFIGIFLLFSSCNIAQDKTNSNDFIYGKWKYIKHLNWRATEFGSKEIESIKVDTLTIEHNKLYFENLNFIEPCTFSAISFKNFFDREDKEPNILEDRALAITYNKEQLSSFIRIETNCDKYNCLNTLYLKQDTLILNYCGGITFYMLKESH